MNKLKILVVDDESRMRKLVRDFLENRILQFWKQETAAKLLIYSLTIRTLR